jgi:hypothetical protein
MTTLERRLLVRGELWCGDKGEVNYSLSGKENPSNYNQVKLIAGDFQTIYYAKFYVLETTVRIVSECLLVGSPD